MINLLINILLITLMFYNVSFIVIDWNHKKLEKELNKDKFPETPPG